MQATLLIAMFILVKFGLAQPTVKVESDEVNNIDFSQYSTFGFTDEISEISLSLTNDIILNGQIRESIVEEMMGLGYRQASYLPDLIVHFHVFKNPAVIKSVEYDGISGVSASPSSADIVSYNTEAGTLWIIFVDAESGEAVWQGFTSGLIRPDKLLHDKSTIRQAVNLVMDQYSHRRSPSQ